MTPDDSITIRRASSPADYRACQEAQRRAWGIAEENYIVPVATMVGAQLHGGLVLGAFRPDGTAAGVSFAFLGRIEGQVGLYSQLTGVVPEYQGHGLGERLKRAQRDLARAEGLPVIAWAFDPLQAGNAHFNLGRLGASAVRYVDDMYGPRTDALNAGTPTDRLIVVWGTDPEAPRPAIDPSEVLTRPRLIAVAPGPRGQLEPGAVVLPPRSPRVLIEVPAEIARLRREAPDLAESWRRAVRAAFTAAFAAGYRAIGFLRDPSAGRRSFYLLEHGAAGHGAG